jgi:hypothetical protein
MRGPTPGSAHHRLGQLGEQLVRCGVDLGQPRLDLFKVRR